jgi:hypothetical protein
MHWRTFERAMERIDRAEGIVDGHKRKAIGHSNMRLDCRAFGGQAGASSCIENYLGFPTGISGMALMARAYNQAQKFGAEMVIPDQARQLSERTIENSKSYLLAMMRACGLARSWWRAARAIDALMSAIRESPSSHREALGRVDNKRKLIVDRFLETRSRAHYACL